MKDYAEKNYNRRTNRIWAWVVTIAWIAVSFVVLARVDTLLFK